MSPWWGTYDGVIPPISLSPAELKAVGEPCYNNTHTGAHTHARTHKNTLNSCDTLPPVSRHTLTQFRGVGGWGKGVGGVGQSREMGGISHFVRRCTMASLRWTTSHRGWTGEEELEAGEEWKRAAQMAHREIKCGKIEDEMRSWGFNALVEYQNVLFWTASHNLKNLQMLTVIFVFWIRINRLREALNKHQHKIHISMSAMRLVPPNYFANMMKWAA